MKNSDNLLRSTENKLEEIRKQKKNLEQQLLNGAMTLGYYAVVDLKNAIIRAHSEETRCAKRVEEIKEAMEENKAWKTK